MSKTRQRWIAVVCAVLAGLSGCVEAPDPRLHSVQLALEHLNTLGAQRVYFTGAAFPGFKQLPPAWLPEADRVVTSPRVRALAQAAQSPKLFRQMDRQEHFDALLLAGDPIQFKPLLEHLIQSGDWALDWVDPVSLVYVRGTREELTMERIRRVAKQWDNAPKRQRAEAWAAIAERLIAAHRKDAGAELLQAAREADAKAAAVSVAEGNYRLARGEWAKAVQAADQALGVDPRNRAARSVKAQGLYYSKKFAQAYEISRGLLQEAEEDPVMLFNHAKIAHEVRAIEEEIGLLRKLIAIADREQRSSSWYRVFLGQAFASSGKGPESLKEFKLALEDPDLPEEQRAFAKEAMRRVEQMIAPIPVTK
jgi:tetratricopeptide (TPR) repeat protein